MEASPPIDRAFLKRLREATAPEHAAIEDAVSLTRAVADKAEYRRMLEKFHGFHAMLEPRLLACALPEALDIESRGRLGWLRQDLAALGLNAEEIAALPRCAAMPPLKSVADCFGCVYVMEGSTLGGQIIARMLAEKHGLGRANGARFFLGYEARTGTMWRGFGDALLAWLEAMETPARQRVEDAVITSAKASFRALQEWMTR